MKNILKILSFLCLLIGFTSCDKDKWYENDMELTPVLYMQNTDAVTSSKLFAFSVYYKLNSFIKWKNNNVIISDSSISDYKDESFTNDNDEDEYLITFLNTVKEKTTEEVDGEEVEKEVDNVYFYELTGLKSDTNATLSVYTIDNENVDNEGNPVKVLKSKYPVTVTFTEKYTDK